MNLTQADVDKWLADNPALARRNGAKPAVTQVAQVTTTAPSKFHAVICEADGIKFSSKKERRRYLELMALQHSGDVKYFLMQVPFRLPGNTKYLLDFLVFWADGIVTHEDVKGMKTAMFVMKKKQVEALYPVRIVEPYNRIGYEEVPGVKVRVGNTGDL